MPESRPARPMPAAARRMAGFRRMLQARLLAPLLLFALLAGQAAWAGSLAKADIERRFGPPLHVQDQPADLPAWPLSSELEPEAGPVGYVFESIDLAPIPGFEGTPINLLIHIDRKGNFQTVELLHQHEPVFLGGLGEQPLKDFLTQYAGRNLKQQFLIALDAARNRTAPGAEHGGQTTLDGVAKATASIRIVNQTALAAALQVARARLGFADPGRHAPAARVRPDLDERHGFADMLANGMIGRLRLNNAEAERLFAGSEGAGLDDEAQRQPGAPFVELYIAYLSAPSIGRSLLGEAQYQAVMARNFDHRHLWWIGAAGRYPVVDDGFVPGGQSRRLAMSQEGLFVELRDQGLDNIAVAGAPPLDTSLIFGIYAEAGLDPGRPVALNLTVTRQKGQILPTLIHREVALAYAPPARLFDVPPAPPPDWLIAWRQRAGDLAILGAALLLLAAVLAKPRRIAVSPRRLALFRNGFLLFTLLYIGWYAQGQLSVVQLTGALKALKAGRGLGSYLYDPVSLLLIAFTLLSFVLWGRGTFCGWLCPFGALQEFVGKLARRLHLPRRRIPLATAKRLEYGRHVVLAGLLAAALFAPALGERLNEVEPFKTAITVGFDRSWPFVAYAGALLLAGAFYYKFFCRFICPLGGALSLGGLLRRLAWLPRRTECGRPCQRCKADCAYDAIEPSGEIRYDACFQCLDCVGIYHDAQRCVPIMLHDRKGKVLAPRAPAAPAAGRSA